MALSSGTKLGVYELVEPIGKGGMGEVYRARDTKLGREVAIKLLPEELSQDSERLARFEREAKLLASLNHPGIATLYGFEQSDGVHFLAMELVPGVTLAERIASGPVPLEEAVAIARQIADALEAAHEAGVIHRDLKPANVKVTDDGQVKVLDFGLAKAFADDATPVDSSLSPTLTREGTQAGVILGTAAYMSPEQARGKAVDKRTDIFAFGCVLFEMLTGRRAFDGETVSDILASVIKLEPDWTAPPVGSRALLKRCLDKEVRKRYRDIGDVRLDLDAVTTRPHEKPSAQGSLWRIVAAALVAFALGGALMMIGRAPTTSMPVVRSQVAPPEGVQFRGISLALSPDGSQLAFVDARAPERRQLWIRRLDELDARALPGTEGASLPFWSQDGRSIGFFAEDTLKVVPAAGGGPRNLVAAPNGRGGTWSEDGVILFASDPAGVIFRVEASGGDAEPVTARDGGTPHRFPHLLPGDRHFLFFTGPPWTISIGEVETGEMKELVRDAYDATYSPPGWIIYVAGGTEGSLFAQRFDPERLTLVGEPISVATAVQGAGPDGGGYTISQSNHLAYWPRGGGLSRVWTDREGNVVGAGTDPASAPGWTYRLSPSGRSLAIGGLGFGVFDLDRSIFQRLPTQSEPHEAELFPAWSPDGSRIAYVTADEIRIVAVDGSSDQRLVGWSAADYARLDWSPDGKTLLLSGTDPSVGEQAQLWRVGIDDAVVEPWLEGDGDYTEGRFSPDGNWVAYRSDETGVSEVYLRPFPGPGRPVRVSTSGGLTPEWRGDGRELFYLTLEGALASVDVRYGETLIVSPPRELIPLVNSNPVGSSTRYDVTPDGQRFLIRREAGRPVELVQGWLNPLGD